MNDQRAKADAGKSDPLLLEADMPRALAIINRVLDYGLIKYERKAWLQVAKERWDAACGRHRRSRYLGEDFDRESGLLHMAHEAAGLIIQIELFVKANPQYDYLTFKQPPTAHKDLPPTTALYYRAAAKRLVKQTRCAVADLQTITQGECND